MDYIAYLHKDKRSDYGVSFPDFPGCITAGRSMDEARRKAAEALSLHIAGMLEDGERIPKPSTLDALADDPDRKDAVAFLVPASSERTLRVNVTARESQLEKIDRLADAAGLNRSAYMVRAAMRAESVSIRRSIKPSAENFTLHTMDLRRDASKSTHVHHRTRVHHKSSRKKR